MGSSLGLVVMGKNRGLARGEAARPPRSVDRFARVSEGERREQCDPDPRGAFRDLRERALRAPDGAAEEPGLRSPRSPDAVRHDDDHDEEEEGRDEDGIENTEEEGAGNEGNEDESSEAGEEGRLFAK